MDTYKGPTSSIVNAFSSRCGSVTSRETHLKNFEATLRADASTHLEVCDISEAA